MAACRNSLIRRGYCRIPPAEALWDAAGAAEHARLVRALAHAVTRAADLGWPLALLLVFDEPWRTARKYDRLLQRMSYGRLELSPCAQALAVGARTATARPCP
ncbi:hypothetical protein HYH03_014857 [Edaphochlamys debaryana]|uniref:Uncharacterized protein n=1 Tax=Edaphochlamys debaryana TaxID=47281 RepID=A0A835XMF7_9CHLO|nr:hypothetical protein HYH03_014857 [Edaphochlamys debaryana]|eukprot:KAG2486556.1 hypothetical protein HYH03_014857 [Edaphochlamys debaryana]